MLATIVFKIVNLVATLGYLLNIIGIFAGYGSGKFIATLNNNALL
jgi:hypothetical protein